MTKCAVWWCKNYSGRTTNVSYHPFPTDPSRKRKWVEAVRREKTWIPTKHHTICSIHFESKCYNERATKQRKLVKDAFPTLHLPKFTLDGQIISKPMETDEPVPNKMPEPEYTNVNKLDGQIISNDMETNEPVSIDIPAYTNADTKGGKIISNAMETTELAKNEEPHSSQTKAKYLRRQQCKSPVIYDTPRKRLLKRKLQEQKSKIKRLQYQNRRLKKKVATLQEILDSLTDPTRT